MNKFKWNLPFTIAKAFASSQAVTVTHNFNPIGLCHVEVIEKKFFIGHFDLSRELKGSEYVLYFFAMNTANGNELIKIDFSDSYVPTDEIKTVKEMINESGGQEPTLP